VKKRKAKMFDHIRHFPIPEDQQKAFFDLLSFGACYGKLVNGRYRYVPIQEVMKHETNEAEHSGTSTSGQGPDVESDS
jgi:hypothetical protein